MPWNIRTSCGRRQRVARKSLDTVEATFWVGCTSFFPESGKFQRAQLFSHLYFVEIYYRYYRFIWLYRIQRRLQRHFLRRDRHKLDVWTRKSGSLRMLSLCICSVHSQLLTSSASSRNVTISVFHVSLADGTRIRSCDAQPRDHEVCPVPTIVLSK